VTVPINVYPPDVILWGGTGSAKVVRPIIEHFGSRVIAVFDEIVGLEPPFPDVPLYGGVHAFNQWIVGRDVSRIGFCIAIGNPRGRLRVRLHEQLADAGLQPVTIAHPSACIAPNAVIGEGSQILPGAIIGAEAQLGRQCIVNMRASIDYEGVLEDGVELAAGSMICEQVYVEANVWICPGATVLPRVRIGADAIVDAGSIVTRNVSSGARVVGAPARQVNGRRS
jgi:sugar O-acyltransferase (sialic acid O-acetyltransferase NeuD family)